MSSKTGDSPAAWLITGCSSGIGREIALAALAKGHNVAVTARNPTAVEEIVAKYPGQVVAPALDVTNRDQVVQAVRETDANTSVIYVRAPFAADAICEAAAAGAKRPTLPRSLRRGLGSPSPSAGRWPTSSGSWPPPWRRGCR